MSTMGDVCWRSYQAACLLISNRINMQHILETNVPQKVFVPESCLPEVFVLQYPINSTCNARWIQTFHREFLFQKDSVARRTWSGQDYGCYWERGERIKGSHICWKVVSRKGQGLALTVIVTGDRPPWGKTPPHSRHNRNGLLRCIQTSTLRQTFYSSNSSWPFEHSLSVISWFCMGEGDAIMPWFGRA